MPARSRRNCRHYALIRPFDKDDLRMLAKVAGFFSNQAACLVPFELSPGQWQAFGNWFMSYLRLFRCHQQLWMMRAPTAICGFGVDRSHAELLLSTQPSVRPCSALPHLATLPSSCAPCHEGATPIKRLLRKEAMPWPQHSLRFNRLVVRAELHLQRQRGGLILVWTSLRVHACHQGPLCGGHTRGRN